MAEGIDISNLNKGDVLAALYNASKPLGMGHLCFTPENMMRKEAEGLLKEQTHFVYIQGRVMKIDLSTDILEPWLYDRDNGEGAAQAVIDGLRQT